MKRKGSDDLSSIAKWITAAFVVLTLMVLAYQRVRRADFTESTISPKTIAPISEEPVSGTLKTFPQEEGVTKIDPVEMRKE